MFVIFGTSFHNFLLDVLRWGGVIRWCRYVLLWICCSVHFN